MRVNMSLIVSFTIYLFSPSNRELPTRLSGRTVSSYSRTMDTELSLKGRPAPTHSVKELGDLARTSDGQGPEVALHGGLRPCNATPSPFLASLASHASHRDARDARTIGRFAQRVGKRCDPSDATPQPTRSETMHEQSPTTHRHTRRLKLLDLEHPVSVGSPRCSRIPPLLIQQKCC